MAAMIPAWINTAAVAFIIGVFILPIDCKIAWVKVDSP